LGLVVEGGRHETSNLLDYINSKNFNFNFNSNLNFVPVITAQAGIQKDIQLHSDSNEKLVDHHSMVTSKGFPRRLRAVEELKLEFKFKF